jgi:hypothetical protein
MNSTIDHLVTSITTVHANLLDRRHHGLDTTRQQVALDNIGYQISLEAPSRVADTLAKLSDAERLYEHGDNPCGVCGSDAELDSHIADLVAR